MELREALKAAMQNVPEFTVRQETGRLSCKNSNLNPWVTEGRKPTTSESVLQRAKQQSRRNGAFGAFMIQSQNAHAMALASWRRLIADGYVEIAPGILRHPETKAEAHNG